MAPTPAWLKAALGQHNVNPPPLGVIGGISRPTPDTRGVSTRAPKAWARFLHALGHNLPYGMHRAEQSRRRMTRQHH